MSKAFEASRAGVQLQAIVERQNQDVLVQLIGGDVAHYGVVTTVSPTTEPQTVALPSRPGHYHQEGVLTELMAKRLKPILQSNAIIVSGVHVNYITSEQLHVMSPLVIELTEKVGQWLTTHPRGKVVEHFSK